MTKRKGSNSSDSVFARNLSIVRQARNFREIVGALTLSRFREMMGELYSTQGMSMKQMARKLQKDYKTINKWIKKLGIKVRPNIAPIHISRLVPQVEMAKTRLDVVNGRNIRLTSIYPTDDLSYLIGFTIGDGWAGSRNIELCNTEFGLLDPLLSVMNSVRIKYGGKIGLQYRDRKGKSVARDKAYSFRIWLNNSNIARLIKRRNKLKYDTIDFLLSAKPEHFLAGLWDADGCISHLTKERLHVEVYLCQGESNFELLERIVNALSRFGIKTSCRVSDKKHEVHEFYGKRSRINENVYRLHVFKESVQDWIKMVGEKMMHPKKIETIKQLKRLIRNEDNHQSTQK